MYQCLIFGCKNPSEMKKENIVLCKEHFKEGEKIMHEHVRITGQPAYWHPVNRLEIRDWRAGDLKDHHFFRFI